MGRYLLLLVVVLAVFQDLWASGGRTDGLSRWGTTWGKHNHRGTSTRSRSTHMSRIKPEQQNNTEILAQVGGSVTIKCYTHYLGNEMVTWLKRDEDHLLTAGSQVYSSDNRFSVAHIKNQDLWELSLRDVRLSDAGLYECQLTTHPPTSLFFTLKVVEARAVIEGHPSIHFHKGHTLRLHCVVERATETPQYIFWYHNGSMVNYYPNQPVRIMKHRSPSGHAEHRRGKRGRQDHDGCWRGPLPLPSNRALVLPSMSPRVSSCSQMVREERHNTASLPSSTSPSLSSFFLHSSAA
ncbi:zwei Ig domain protein zig-8-like isoform X2 [Eriocheir sinensis]|uniref:zwei Ig domain protein zig-8-like isoform X2 n=1 Tax=Eriocheir sinensis TaxID=95602 RepID=UPI0021C8445D|nr:zwei Ig domain protein zig-8-like isoform X2 [Eriocheir sinensis]